MLRYYRAVALDLDGTLSRGGPPDRTVLDAMRAVRAAGVHPLLVTGRVLVDLDADLPGLVDEFDAVVGENGGVLAVDGVVQRLAEPVDPRLAERLHGEGVAVRRGQVLLACDSSAAHTAFDAVRAMQLDVSLVWNRAALMLLPGGVTKGTGVRAGLAALGLSPRSAIGVGDAENDHALLGTCELGVAVANSVAALSEHADLVLREPDGAGVAALLGGPIVRGAELVPPRRRRLVLGHDADGDEVTVPASQCNVLVTGNSGAGKSYVTGLLAEQMIGLGYSVLLVDPEGDHTALGSLRNTLLVGDSGRLPNPQELVRIIEHERSVVLDLSLARTDIVEYLAGVHRELRLHRERTGLPHWFVIDEAHLPTGPESAVHEWGYCLATYQPQRLAPGTVASMQWQVQVLEDRPGEAVLTTDGPDGDRATTFRIAPRTVAHVRHQHKYTDTELPPERGFHFRTDRQHTGAVATNLRQFVAELERCDPEVVRHHTTGRDFSRWARYILRDAELADRLRRAESRRSEVADNESLRAELLDAITSRYRLPDRPDHRPRRGGWRAPR